MDEKQKTSKTSVKDIDKENKLVSAAIEKYGYEVILEDKSFDMLAAMVYRKVYNSLPHYQEAKQSGGSQSGGSQRGDATSSLLKLFLIISIANMVIQMFESKNGNKSGGISSLFSSLGSSNSTPEKSKNVSSVIAGPFEFKKASQIGLGEYFGKTEVFERFEDQIFDFIKNVKLVNTGIKMKSDLDKKGEFNKTSFVLQGPPGTGKTMFVQRLATRVDNKLKLCYLEEKDPKLYKELMNSPEEGKAEEAGTKLNEYLAKMESRLYFCEVSTGVANSKYFGESEKNINLLYQFAGELSCKNKENWQAVILFFDEGDVFFGNRSSDTSDGGSSSNIKSELLQRIGVRPSDSYKSVFTFCATNRWETFDPAFVRRYSKNQIFLGYPDADERSHFITSMLSEFEKLNDKELRKLVALTAGRTQSFISKYAQDYFKEENDGTISGFQIEAYIKFLIQNRENTNML
ncbi:hypothetical protein GINT2_001101 [Glugoides intestinalis]